MCGSQYSSLLKMSENIKSSSKIQYIGCACVAPRRHDLWRQDVLSRRHILHRRPQGLFLQKVTKKGTNVNLFDEKG